LKCVGIKNGETSLIFVKKEIKKFIHHSVIQTYRLLPKRKMITWYQGMCFISLFMYFLELNIALSRQLSTPSARYYATTIAGSGDHFNNSNVIATVAEIEPTTVWGESLGNIFLGNSDGIIDKIEADKICE
jgi:hypothetical protein